MTYDQTPQNGEVLRFPSQVETAVIATGIADFNLAHAAGVLADADRFELLVPGPDHEEKPRTVLSVTGVSLNPAGETFYRTATFGVIDHVLVDKLNRVGSTMIESFKEKAVTSNPRITAFEASKIALMGLYERVNEGGMCTLGGVAVFREGSGSISAHGFISTPFRELILSNTETRRGKVSYSLGRLAARVQSLKTGTYSGGSPQIQKDLAVFGAFLRATAKSEPKPGGPVVVKSSLTITA